MNGKKILVVDDFATMRRIIKSYLKNLGHHDLHEAENGRQALERLRGGGFDLIVTDWNMPVMTGYELLKEVRGNKDFSHIPVLMVTAESKREQIIQAAHAGVNGYIVKPFNEITLREKLQKVFNRVAA
jgi:two-component system chemotaxis response regulator CheY